MPKEYRTIQEVAGPLMLVKEVEGVAFNELGEIELANGEKRRCRVLEIDGTNALVQLFESSVQISSTSLQRFSQFFRIEICITYVFVNYFYSGLKKLLIFIC